MSFLNSHSWQCDIWVRRFMHAFATLLHVLLSKSWHDAIGLRQRSLDSYNTNIARVQNCSQHFFVFSYLCLVCLFSLSSFCPDLTLLWSNVWRISILTDSLVHYKRYLWFQGHKRINPTNWPILVPCYAWIWIYVNICNSYHGQKLTWSRSCKLLLKRECCDFSDKDAISDGFSTVVTFGEQMLTRNMGTFRTAMLCPKNAWFWKIARSPNLLFFYTAISQVISVIFCNSADNFLSSHFINWLSLLTSVEQNIIHLSQPQ